MSLECLLERGDISLEAKEVIKKALSEFDENLKITEELQISNDFLLSILNSLEIPFFVVNIEDYTVKFANAAASNRYSKINQTCYNLTHGQQEPCCGEKHICPLSKIKKTKKPMITEHIHSDKNGNPEVVEIHAHPIFDRNGELIQIIEFQFDITERRQQEEELISAEQKYHMLVENMIEGVMLVDEDGYITFVNPRILEISGYSEEELIGKPSIVLTAEETVGIVNGELEKCSRDISSKYEAIIKSRDGLKIPVQVSGTPVFTDTKEYLGALVVLTDITELKKNELEIRKTKARLEYLLKSGPAVIYSCTPEGHFETTFMSENIKEILGYKAENFINNPSFWEKNLHPDNRERVIESFSKVLNTNFFSEMYRFQQKDGSYRWMLEEANLIRDEQGNPLEIVGYWTDITQQKKIEEQLWNERENLYRILNSTDDIIYIINPQHEIEFINAATEKEFGPAEGKKCYEFFNDFTEACSWCTAEKVVKGETIRREKTLPRNEKTYDMIDTPFKNLDGNISSLAILRDITDRKQVEEALKESEKNFRELVDLLPAIVFEIDPFGNFIFSNRLGLEVSGYTQEDLNQGLNALQLFVPEDRPIVKQNIMKILEGAKVEGHEYTALRKDGSTFPVLVYSAPVYRGKKPVKLRGIVVDITQLKVTEKALRESEEKYRTFVENFQGIAFKGYEDFSAGFFHGKVEEITGYSENAFISGEIVFNQLIHPEDIHWINDEVKKFMSSSQRTTQREYRIIIKNGNLRWIQESIQKFYDEKKKKGGVYGTLQDITERKRAEDALRESQDLFAQFMDHLPAAAFIKDNASVTLFANQYLKDVFGEEKWIGKTVMELFPKEAARKMLADDQKALNEGLQIITEELIDKHDVVNTYRTYKFPIMRKNKESLLGGITIDITTQKKAEEKLRESEQKFRTFIETLPEPVWIYQDYECRYANPAAEQTTGYSMQELSSMKFQDFLHSDYKYMAIEGGKALENGLSPPLTNAIVKILTKNGNEKWLDTRLELIEFEEKQATLISAMDITERKKAEEALRESEVKYRNLVERANDGIAIVKDNKLVLINQKLAKMLGYAIEELLNKDYTSVLHPDVILMIKDRYEARIAGKDVPSIYESKLKKKDGSILIVELNVGLIDYQGDKTATLSFIRDITKRKQAEEALQESEEKYRSLVELAHDGIVIIQDMKFEFLNRQAAEMLGYSVEELLRTPFAKVVHPDELNSTLKRYQARMTGQNVPSRYEMRLLRKDGTPLDAEINVTMITYQDRMAEFAMARDITEQKQAQNALKESEERLRKFMESATNGFSLLDSNLNFIDMNNAGLKGLGLSKGEVVGKNLLDIFPKLKDSSTLNEYLKVLNTGNPFYIDDIDSVPQIRQKYYSIRAFKVGEGLGIITTDITNRVKAEKTREELEQRRDSFVWMTSHELRTPLTVLTGYCDFLTEHINDLTQNRITNILDVMKNNLDRLERLTSKVSTIGQIEQGIFDIEKTSMNLCDFLQTTLASYHQLLGNQFDFQGCLEDSSIMFEGDPLRLQQVLDNIIGNAIKHTDKNNRRIRVTSKISPFDIKIEVTDNGAGIAPENLEVIFDQFVSIPTEFSATGTGIGLYLCQKTLEAHEGRIIAQSEGLGHGATFIIELPRKITVD